MPQDPLLVDQIQIEPGSGDTLIISRDAATGELKFVDAVNTSGLTLGQLAGMNTIDNVLTVGTAGAGAQYTVIQDALDAIPTIASATNPYIVQVLPGEYKETVTIYRDGVILQAVGAVILRSALEDTPDAPGNDHTVIIKTDMGTTPKAIQIQNFKITNIHTNKACVRVEGAAASTLGQSELLLQNCSLEGRAVGGNRNLWATTANHITVNGGDWTGQPSTLMLVEECASLTMQNVRGLGAVQFRYDTAQPVASEAPTSYSFSGTDVGIGTILTPVLSVDLDGAGDFSMPNGTVHGNTILDGTESLDLGQSVVLGNLTLLGTVMVTFDGKLTGTLNSNINVVLDIDELGTGAFAAVTSLVVVFKIPKSNTNYQVNLTPDARPNNDETPWITNKLVTGFTINFQTAQTLNVDWKVSLGSAF